MSSKTQQKTKVKNDDMMKGELLTTMQEMLEKTIEGKLLQEIQKEIRN